MAWKIYRVLFVLLVLFLPGHNALRTQRTKKRSMTSNPNCSNNTTETRVQQRIALELSGQLRSFRESLPQLLILFGFYSDDIIIDTFAMVTPDDGLREKNLPCLLDMLGDSLKELILFPRTPEDTTTQDRLIADCKEDTRHLNGTLDLKFNEAAIDRYCRIGILQSYPRFIIHESRKRYALENDITYDLVIQSRYDMYLYHSQIKPFESIVHRTIKPNEIKSACDMFFMGQPEAMDKLAQIAWNTPAAKCLWTSVPYDCPSDLLNGLGTSLAWPEGNYVFWQRANNITMTPTPSFSMHYNRHKDAVACDSYVPDAYNDRRPIELQKAMAERLARFGIQINQTNI